MLTDKIDVRDQTSHWYHTHPKARKWDTSYTRDMVIRLVSLKLAFYEPKHPGVTILDDAIKLLEGYWRDLHIPYEQRDQARAEASRYKALYEVALDVIQRRNEDLAVFRKQEFRKQEAVLKDTQKAVDEIRASRNARTACVEFFACKHYPCATSNHFAGLSVCEHGCEKTPLRWWEGGVHSKP